MNRHGGRDVLDAGDVVLDDVGLQFTEGLLTLVDLAAGVFGCPNPVALGEIPVEVNTDTVGARYGHRVLPPEPVLSPGVLVPVGVGHGDDVPLKPADIVRSSTLAREAVSVELGPNSAVQSISV